ncbi:pyridoxal-phosphate dependent enzyme [Parachlamydia acanthamoebae]|uniref:pyridoxal-phosphate dependent enzyme n=1 Tax=Parachlamydia acanthamoebae TaxID=83552 RepID=UPI00075106D7|nr:pyridoxal-phosphate dependent enzyme [Parachlamydia acanthamoebae]
MKITKRYSDSICLPNLIEIEENLILASFSLMKLLPAKYVIEKAIRDGSLQKGSTIIETSSGTYALGLAIICAENHFPFHIISDPVMDKSLIRQLEYLGGKVEIVSDAINGHQVARLKTLNDHLSKNPTFFWPQQYDNPDHLKAYASFGDYIIESLGEDITLVASVGSGSSSCGTIMQLRKYNPSISLIGVDTFGSTLFGLKNNHRILRGLGNSIMPKNLLHQLFDQIHWISAAQAFHATRDLYSRSALYAGPTTGACYQVAKWVSQQQEKKKIVFISADMGYRYSSNVYDDEWIKKSGCDFKKIEPIKIEKVSEIDSSSLDWNYIEWNRRLLQKVLNA